MEHRALGDFSQARGVSGVELYCCEKFGFSNTASVQQPSSQTQPLHCSAVQQSQPCWPALFYWKRRSLFPQTLILSYILWEKSTWTYHLRADRMDLWTASYTCPAVPGDILEPQVMERTGLKWTEGSATPPDCKISRVISLFILWLLKWFLVTGQILRVALKQKQEGSKCN